MFYERDRYKIIVNAALFFRKVTLTVSYQIFSSIPFLSL